MNRLIKVADDYIKDMKWWEVGLLKCCLCALGVLIGLAVPKRHRKCVTWIALTAFILTYIPLILKLVRMICPCCKESLDLS